MDSFWEFGLMQASFKQVSGTWNFVSQPAGNWKLTIVYTPSCVCCVKNYYQNESESVSCLVVSDSLRPHGL